MPRRVWFSAALAALAVPVVLTGTATAADSGGSTGGSTDDPGAQAQVRKSHRIVAPRKPVMSRRAKRDETDTPLAVTIDQLTPSTIPEKGVVRVSGTVTNNDIATWRNINAYGFISADPLTSATQLDDAANSPADSFVGERITDLGHYDTIPELAAGDSMTYSFNIPRKLLQADKPGVYWFGVHALGEGPEGRDGNADGRARTFLPLVPEARQGQLRTALVIPLRHQLDYTDDGSVDDLAGWTKALTGGGRLQSLVDFGASSGDRTVTWVIDPALVDAVRRIAEGNPPRSLEPNLQAGQEDGEDDSTADTSASADPTEASETAATPTPETDPAGDSPLDLDELDPVVQTAAEAAQAWLARLGEAMRPEDQVMTLPYGDLDVTAAARHDPQLYQRAVARAGTSLPGFDVTTTPVLSSPSGFLSADGIQAADPASTILLTDGMFESPAPALANTLGHDVVVTSTGAAEGGPGPDSRTGMTAMRQRLLAEAAVRFLHNPDTSLTMVVPHDWNPSGAPTYFGGLDVPWLDLTSVGSVTRSGASNPVVGDTLHYPDTQEAAELDAANFEAADALMRSGAALQNLLTLNNLVSGTVTDQALGSASYSARTRPIASRTSADRSRLWIDQRLGQVRVSAPRAVTLSSSSGQFAATITNQLDQPVTVSLDAQSDDRLRIEGPRRVDVGAGNRATVLLTARTDENGIHEVRLLVTDKRGTPLGATTSLSVRSVQVSNVIWLFLGIGAALLFGAIGVRLFRRVRNARRTPADPEHQEADSSSTVKEPAGAGTR